ncbi:MAG: hypothetical protein JXQ29_13110 [Planctomycetes bacterium]|nr:hypothetical protein [Planctomycetota bacterium]
MSEQMVRALNAQGVSAFRAYLGRLRAGLAEAPPETLLTDPEQSEAVEGAGAVAPQRFRSRLEAAEHLGAALDGVSRAAIESHVGLWSWLSLYYFDQVCPPARDGSRKPGRDYRHILDPDFRYAHRHLLAGPFGVYRLHGERAALLLCTRVHVENRFHHELASRQSFISNPAILEAAHRLYEGRRRRPKRGAQGGRAEPGTLGRFIDVVQQLEVNYDLYSMDPEAILDLLPPEFDSWKPFGVRRRGRRARAKR